MAKVEAFEFPGIELIFHTRNEHPPHHFHAIKSGKWNIRVNFMLCREKHLIADANVIDGNHRLLVLSCANEPFEVPFEAIRDLAKMPARVRGDFEIAEDGSYIHWPKFDVHLDLDEIRYATDPQSRAAVAAQSIEYDVNFGKAVAALRKELGLRQSNIEGLSERQVGRIERGSRPRLNGCDLSDPSFYAAI